MGSWEHLTSSLGKRVGSQGIPRSIHYSSLLFYFYFFLALLFSLLLSHSFHSFFLFFRIILPVSVLAASETCIDKRYYFLILYFVSLFKCIFLVIFVHDVFSFFSSCQLPQGRGAFVHVAATIRHYPVALGALITFVFSFFLICTTVKPLHCRHCHTTVALWWSCIVRPCTSGAGGDAPPFVVVSPLVALFFAWDN